MQPPVDPSRRRVLGQPQPGGEVRQHEQQDQQGDDPRLVRQRSEPARPDDEAANREAGNGDRNCNANRPASPKYTRPKGPDCDRNPACRPTAK